MINEFDIFRINCWLEDLEDYNYETSISVTTFEYLLSKENKEQLRKEVFNYISKTLGIKLQIDTFIKITDNCNDLIKVALEDDVLIQITDSSLQKFREKFRKNSIEHYITKFVSNSDLTRSQHQSIKDILLKSLYININSFVVSDLKTLLSETIRQEFSKEETDIFNNFLDWDNLEKNKAIYAIFSKSIEFALLTSGRGVKAISKDIFTNKIYYLDTNIVIRALGVDGEQRKESILSVLESCDHDGIEFKLAKSSFDELNGIINARINDIIKKTSSDSEEILIRIIDKLPLNNSFETDYLKKRKNREVTSPNNYRLSIEQELEKFTEKFHLTVDTIKGISSSEIEKFSEKLFEAKKRKLKFSYSKKAALVDAKNILHVKKIRGENNYNYKDIKSFYLTTDGTLNEIVSNEKRKTVTETILPSQLFVIHNSFHKKTTDEDYNDFIKFIKLRKTNFKLPGKEVFSTLEQIRQVTSEPDDIVSSLTAYANYQFKNKSNSRNKSKKIIPIKEFTLTLLEKELGSTRNISDQLIKARNNAVARLPKLFNISKYLSIFTEFLILTIAAVILHLVLKNTGIFIISVLAIIVFRLILLFMKDTFGFHKCIRNVCFDYLSKKQSFFKVHSNDSEYLKAIEKLKGTEGT